MTIHDHTDPATGQPLCVDCYDYTAHLVWQWWAPELWRRFTITLRRQLAQHLQLSETAAGQLVRVQFAKVAEYQRRGVIHFHALIRLDGPPTELDPYPAPRVERRLRRPWPISSGRPPATCPTSRRRSTATISRGGCGSAPSSTPARSPAPPTGTAHGAQLHPETVAAYIAKYATKAAADLPTDQDGGNRPSAPAAGHAAAAGRPSRHRRPGRR